MYHKNISKKVRKVVIITAILQKKVEDEHVITRNYTKKSHSQKKCISKEHY